MNILARLQTYKKRFHSKWLLFVLRLMGADVGRGVTIYPGANIYNQSKLKIGNDVFINDGFWCNAKGEVVVGDDVIMGPNVVIHSSNHNYMDVAVIIRKQGHTDAPVRINKNVWIGANVVILPGVEVVERAVIAAGAVVTKSIVEPGVYAGVPAKKIHST